MNVISNNKKKRKKQPPVTQKQRAVKYKIDLALCNFPAGKR